MDAVEADLRLVKISGGFFSLFRLTISYKELLKRGRANVKNKERKLKGKVIFVHKLEK